MPLLPGVTDFAAAGIIPEGAHKNKEFYSKWVTNRLAELDPLEMVLYDPQTSGGLLIAAAPEVIAQISQQLKASSYGLDVAVIGDIIEAGPARIEVI